MTAIIWCNEFAIKINYQYMVYQEYPNGLIPIYDSVNTNDSFMGTYELIMRYIEILKKQGYIKA